MSNQITCGEATMNLLARYGVTTVFGIPGVHTLDFCRGLDNGGVRHVQTRNEQGAGFMAEGWARATGEVGVALVISGPGVTNATTALGQCYADSLPMLLISAEAASNTIGKGWGVLHEVTEQKKVTEPLTGYSATAYRAADVPEIMARAFAVLKGGRPRPVHISIPIDVQAEMVDGDWRALMPADLPPAAESQIAQAAALLKSAKNPLIMTGGGASGACVELTAIAEATGAIVVASTAGKGIVPDNHPLSLSASTVRPEVQALLGEADVILAVGTELAETDSFVERMDLNGKIIRVDIDPSKINDFYPAEIGIVADAALAMTVLAAELADHRSENRAAAEARVTAVRAEIAGNLTGSERQHVALLDGLRAVAPENTIWSGDSCQLVYTGAFAMDVTGPRQWFYPAGYCALGNALPNGIGAKMARPDRPVAVLAGDGGFMFTMPELVTAAEEKLALPIIIWENGGLKQIQDDMDRVSCDRVGVEGINPDFVMLAKACHCHGLEVSTVEEAQGAFVAALSADRPTVIVFHESPEG
ncbi:5-guanidino-2-oxopentanoate decarboxylase [Ruegeria sp.]|uniref:5-guanidino-2-oxopentanoate decarboxylase n=1 Tax=Ruegeria sp. TaxID=1879320 RepID=UPI003C7B9EEC